MSRSRLYRRSLPCVHLGPVVVRSRCGCWAKDTHACPVVGGEVRHVAECRRCESYVPRPDDAGDTTEGEP